MNDTNLNGKWRLRSEPLSRSGMAGCMHVLRQRSKWLDAKVPGEVHADLIRAGLMPEPSFGDNAKRCRWVERRSWWYRRHFTMTPQKLDHEQHCLIFDGLDLDAEIFLNGEPIGESHNAFIPAVFNVTGRLRPGRNELVVRLICGEGEPFDGAHYEVALPVRGSLSRGDRRRIHMRKPQFSFGWDWVDALPNIGIWRSVRMESRSGVTLGEVHPRPIIDGKTASVAFEVALNNLHDTAERKCTLAIEITPPRGRRLRRRMEVSLPPGISQIKQTIDIPDPQFWWPRGMGSQPLYDVKVTVGRGSAHDDRWQGRIGLREVTVSRAANGSGSRFCLQVNGQDVFCRGGNWVPADMIPARIPAGRYRQLIAEACEANFNMLRVWGGGIYEHQAFYDTCDELGILVWQDFMFACAEYPDRNERFRRIIRDEAESVVRRLRHHACLAIWCGNNENHWGFDDWWPHCKATRDPRRRGGGAVIYNEVLAEVVQQFDPDHVYWPGSPCGGDKPNSQTAGDCHYWHAGTMHADVDRRVDHEVYDRCRARFVSEYGVIGPPHLSTIRRYLPENQLRFDSSGWKLHTNPWEDGTLRHAIARHYHADPDLTLQQYILFGQMFQATMYGRSVEALRFRKQDRQNDCAGALIWMFNDCWGEVGWTPIDHALRHKPSFYWLRRACAPLKVIARRRGRKIVVRVVNDSLEAWQGPVAWGFHAVDGKTARARSRRVSVAANSAVQVADEPLPPARKIDRSDWVFGATLGELDTPVDQCVLPLRPMRQINLIDARIDVARRRDGWLVNSPVFVHGLHWPDEGRGVLHDNYIDLLPGVPVLLGLRKPGKAAPRWRAVLQSVSAGR